MPASSVPHNTGKCCINDKTLVVRASCPHQVYLTQTEFAVTGNRFWATLLFVTCVGFFPFTYLISFFNDWELN
ncbi:MAG: hypothetical protein ACK48B_13295 [Dolichospermum sp.]